MLNPRRLPSIRRRRRLGVDLSEVGGSREHQRTVERAWGVARRVELAERLLRHLRRALRPGAETRGHGEEGEADDHSVCPDDDDLVAVAASLALLTAVGLAAARPLLRRTGRVLEASGPGGRAAGGGELRGDERVSLGDGGEDAGGLESCKQGERDRERK